MNVEEEEESVGRGGEVNPVTVGSAHMMTAAEDV